MAKRVHGTLTENQVEEVTLDADYDTIEVLNRDGAAEIYISVDRKNPVIGGDFDVLPAAISSIELRSPSTADPTVVKLISSGTPKFSVRGIH